MWCMVEINVLQNRFLKKASFKYHKYYHYYMNYLKKTITITKEQNNWVDKETINLSRFVQKAIEGAMRK